MTDVINLLLFKYDNIIVHLQQHKGYSLGLLTAAYRVYIRSEKYDPNAIEKIYRRPFFFSALLEGKIIFTKQRAGKIAVIYNLFPELCKVNMTQS